MLPRCCPGFVRGLVVVFLLSLPASIGAVYGGARGLLLGLALTLLGLLEVVSIAAVEWERRDARRRRRLPDPARPEHTG